mmetsp:Transcript_9281/g.30716  ORF Transcript_9281/g.30716 Transcript_9281/m.30716 type:complete len:250 (+) Transcript_9281:485-1234(+)
MADSTTMGTPASTWSPALALTSKTTPGMGAPTDPTTPGTAFSRFTWLSLAVVSATKTERGMPLNSKKTSRVASLGLSCPTAESLMPSVLPFSSSTSISSPSFIGSMKARVGSLDTSPYCSRSSLYCSNTFGYMTYDIRSVSSTLSYLALSLVMVASKSSGGRDSPGRPLKVGRSLTICVRSGSGKPPCGMPMAPWKNSTTDEGKESESACWRTVAASSLLVTMNWARSPTTLEEGVTLTMSPRSLLASP